MSLDSASTPKEFVKRELELGTGALTVTDHGSMGCCRAVYDLAKKSGLTPILGVEAYFRDDNCPILREHGITDVPAYAKYFHITLHAMDQEGYEALVQVLSNACLTRMERHGSEEKPLFDWADLERLAQYNITFTTGCLIGMVQRHLLLGRVDIAQAYFNKLVSMVRPGNLYVEVFPHKTDKQWDSGLYITLDNGEVLRYWKGKKLLVNLLLVGGRQDFETTAEELAKKWTALEGEIYLVAVKDRQTWSNLPERKLIKEAKLVEDYIPNECFPWCPDGDSQKGTNRVMLHFAGQANIPVLISDDAHFAYPHEKVLQDIRLRSGGDSWRFYASYHRFTSDEAWEYFSGEMGVAPEQFIEWLRNNVEWAGRFKDFSFKDRRELPTRFYPEDTLAHTKTLMDKHGRMDWSNPKYVERIQAEIEMLHYNGVVDLLPYFFVDEEVCDLYRKHGLLTGPGRGSAAGLLLAYCLGITHVDPLKYQLSMERFLTPDRIKNGKWPDIDQDLPHRDLLVDPADPSRGWLRERFGDCVAQISTDTSLKIRSSIKDVARVFGNGRVPPEIEKLAGGIEVAPQGVEDREFVFGYEDGGGWVPGTIETDPNLRKYAAEYPEQWAIVQQLLGLTRQKSRHACAFVILNDSISKTMPVTKIGKYTVTQYNAKSVESAGGLKMDFLIIGILNDISMALKLIREQNGIQPWLDRELDGKVVPAIRQLPFRGQIYDIWDLPQSIEVYRDICNQKTETVFQLNTNGAKQYLRLFNKDGEPALTSIEDIAAFTALDRPGPLDAYVVKDGKKHNMLVEYANRATGKGAVDPLPILQELIPETHGVIVYQEQLQKIYQIVGKTTAIEADNFRVHVGKKYEKYEEFRLVDKEVFMRGAVESVGQETAEKLWDQMYTFGQYGFNKSHAVCYITISYACAFLKHYFPLEWWTAVLSNADRNEIDEKFWRYCGHLVRLPDIKLSSKHFEIVGDKIQAPLSLLHGVGEKAHVELLEGAPYTDIKDFAQKIRDRRIAGGTWVKKEKKIKATKKRPASVVVEDQFKMGYSALHRGVVYSIIISGAMDSLFPKNTNVYDKLLLYEQAVAEVNGGTPEAVDPVFVQQTQMQVFQRRKAILPAYTEPLLPMMLDAGLMSIHKIEDTYYYEQEDEVYRFVDADEYEAIDNPFMLPEGGVKVAVAAYVIAQRKFKYQKSKTAVEYILDHDGNRIKVVKWGRGKEGKLPHKFEGDYTGSIVIMLLSKWKEDRPFAVDDIQIVSDPLKVEKEKSK